jgi:hypothetical protein
MDFLKKFFEVLYNFNAFKEISNRNYILPSMLFFIISTTTFNSLKISINYDKYREIMLNQMDNNLNEIKKNLKKQDLTLEEIEKRLENYKKIYLTSISLEIIILSEIAKGIFIQPIILFIQTLAFSLLFFIFSKIQISLNFKKLFSILIYSKSPIIIGSFIVLILSIILKDPFFSLNFSNFIPYEFVSNNNYLKVLRNMLFHIELFSILSLILLSFGINKAFEFPLKNAIYGVFIIYFSFLILNALFYLIFFK